MYMLLDFAPGGDCFSHLRAQRRFSPATAAHYVGCIVLALDYIHSRGVVYRDLKYAALRTVCLHAGSMHSCAHWLYLRTPYAGSRSRSLHSIAPAEERYARLA